MELKADNSVNKHNNILDLVRFICAILVVMGHIVPLGYTEEVSFINKMNFGLQKCLARLAVPSFFLISGYLLYGKSKLESFDIQSTKKYALKILRIYIIWSAIYFPANVIEFFRDEEGIFHAILAYIKDFIFSTSFSHLWYLNALIFAVILVSILLYEKLNPVKILVIAYIFYFIGLFAQSWFGLLVLLRESVSIPYIWTALKTVQKIIVTTRDGLFFGFLYVAMGMIFAFYKINITKRKALIGFVISILLFLMEVFLLKRYDFIREYDMYFFSVPTIFFGFSLIYDIQLPDNKIYKYLRTLSSLIYYMHIGISWMVIGVLVRIKDGLEQTCLTFLLTLVVTIIFGIVIMKLSDCSGFKWLRKLYS